MSNKMITTAISAILTMGIVGTANAAENATTEAPAMNHDMSQMLRINNPEKCYGIAKKGQNDCGTASHGCAGESKMDRDKSEWMAVPKGLCNRIAGGSTTPEKA